MMTDRNPSEKENESDNNSTISIDDGEADISAGQNQRKAPGTITVSYEGQTKVSS